MNAAGKIPVRCCLVPSVSLTRMQRLPGHQCAIIPEEKLRYCLDPMHEEGRDKARVFRSALGIGLEDAAKLESMLREGISGYPALHRGTFRDGTERWMVEWRVAGRLGPLRLISAWSVDGTTRMPRLVSCYLKKVRA